MHRTHFPTSMYLCLFSSLLDDTLPHWDRASDTKLIVSSTEFTYKAAHTYVQVALFYKLYIYLLFI